MVTTAVRKMTMQTTVVLILCMYTWCPAPWHLHVELDSVHAQDGVSYVTEQVTG